MNKKKRNIPRPPKLKKTPEYLMKEITLNKQSSVCDARNDIVTLSLTLS